MDAVTSEEEFSVTTDWKGGRARIGLTGSAGAEILIALPLNLNRQMTDDELEALILKEGASRLRAALLSLMARNWPSEEG